MSATVHSHLYLLVCVCLLPDVTGLKVAAHSSRVKQPINTVSPVYLDGETPVEAQVEEFHNAFPLEMYYKFKLTPDQKDQMNGTHIKLSPGDFFEIDYIKKVGNYEEVGFIRSMLFQQDGSGFSENATGGFAEKRHVTSTTFPLEQQATTLAKSASVLQQKSEEQKSEEAEESMVIVRRSLTSIFGNSSLIDELLDKYAIGPLLSLLEGSIVQAPVQMMQSAGIPNAELIELAQQSKAVPALFYDRLNVLRNGLFSAGEIEGNESLYSMVNCFHFEGAVFDDDEDVLVFPLNKLLPAYRGETRESPYESYDLLQGHAIFKHFSMDSEDFVGIYYGAVIHSHFLPPESNSDQKKNKIRLGPASGIGGPVKITSYNDIGPSWWGHNIYLASTKIPQDERYLWTASCSEDLQQEIIALAEQLEPVRTSLVYGCGGTTVEGLQIMAFVMKALPCGAEFLRPDGVDSARLDSFMMFAWLHMSLEIQSLLWKNAFNYEWR